MTARWASCQRGAWLDSGFGGGLGGSTEGVNRVSPLDSSWSRSGVGVESLLALPDHFAPPRSSLAHHLAIDRSAMPVEITVKGLLFDMCAARAPSFPRPPGHPALSDPRTPTAPANSCPSLASPATV